MFGMGVLVSFIGLMMGSLFSLLPIDVPPTISVSFFMFGSILFVVGQFMILIRLKKTGAIHLLDVGNPDKIIWFYIRKDGTVRITPSIRKAEAMLYNQDMDAHVPDIKGYQLADHQIRFILEETGSVADLDYCMYANVLRSKYGFENLQGIFNRVMNSKIIDKISEAKEFTLRQLWSEPKHRVPIPDAPVEDRIDRYLKGLKR